MIFSRETRRKLSALRRRPPGAPPKSHPIASASEAAPEPVSDDEEPEQAPTEPVPVERLLPGEAVENDFGVCYVMRPEVSAPTGWQRSAVEALRGLTWPGRIPMGDMAFVDIETLGLSGMPIFLVGVLRCDSSALGLTQFLARDFPEEAALLAETVSALQDCGVLFTYNGAAFDLPYLQERSIYHAVEWELDVEHVDLLKPARRRFRARFPDCRLQTLESLLCGREREDDIPGAEIPQRYQEFVRTGDGRLLEVIVRHNQRDLLTLAEIVPYCLGLDPRW